MPRAAWAAVGAIAAALAGSLAGDATPLAETLVVAMLGATWLVRGFRRSAHHGLAAAFVGSCLVVVRLAAGSVSAMTPTAHEESEGSWSARVTIVSAPRDGR